jgi:hypothetical protein
MFRSSYSKGSNSSLLELLLESSSSLKHLGSGSKHSTKKSVTGPAPFPNANITKLTVTYRI